MLGHAGIRKGCDLHRDCAGRRTAFWGVTSVWGSRWTVAAESTKKQCARMPAQMDVMFTQWDLPLNAFKVTQEGRECLSSQGCDRHLLPPRVLQGHPQSHHGMRDSPPVNGQGSNSKETIFMRSQPKWVGIQCALVHVGNPLRCWLSSWNLPGTRAWHSVISTKLPSGTVYWKGDPVDSPITFFAVNQNKG